MCSNFIRPEYADATHTQAASDQAGPDKTQALSTLRATECVLSGSRFTVSFPTESLSFSGHGKVGCDAQEPTGATIASKEDMPPSTSGGDASRAQDQSERNSNTHHPTLNVDWVCIEDTGLGYPTSDLGISNIVIFGESGVGKSSIINLISGKDLANTSPEARGSMAQHQSYDGLLGGIRCRIWDTVGLNGGVEGATPSDKAENNLKKHIEGLERMGRLNLLIYCVRSGRLKKPHQRSYEIFYSEVCQRRVPIALVITNLENEEDEMEMWWRRNEEHILKLGMVFDSHVCVTTDPNFEELQLDSQRRLRDLVFRSLQDGLIPNIVILGETNVGKSSVINLIAGQTLVPTSNKAQGSTFQNQSYVVSLDKIKCRIWSITGIEGAKRTFPASQAEHNLEESIQRMAHSGGINLLVYCIRGARLTKALRSNYDIFYSGVCRKKVPVALVVTGLENEKNGMEAWWDKNEQTLRGHGMRFDAHACVTTLDLGDKVGQERQSRSQERLRDLVVTYSKYSPWKIEQSFMSWLFPTLGSLLRATPSPSKETTRTVIIYDMAPDSPTVTECAPGIVTPISTGLIGYQRYEFIRIDKRLLQSSTKPPRYVGGLLIFYTSPLVDTGIPPEDVDTLRMFYDIAGGLLCPMIVVLRGCNDDGVARTCWDAVVFSHNNIQGYPTSLGDADDSSHGETKLMKMVERLWVNPEGVQSTQLRKP